MSSGQSADPRIVRLVRPASPVPGEASARQKETVSYGQTLGSSYKNLQNETVSFSGEGKPVNITIGDGSPPPPDPVKRKKGQRIDWEDIEGLYRAGSMSVRAIAARHGISHTAINMKAKELNWLRDLTDRIEKATEAKLQRALITRTLSTPVSDSQIVESYASLQVSIRMAQRERFQRMASLTMNMFEELEKMVANRPKLEELGELMFSPNENGMDRLNDIYRKVIEFPGQVRSLKDLTSVIDNLTEMEARTYKLDTTPEGQQGKRKQLTVRFVDAVPQIEQSKD